MARPMQISPPRVNSEVHAWLMDMSTATGLTISTLVGEILDRARVKGWTVEPLRVREPPDDARRYPTRPGRVAVTVPDLADLRGPAEGTVELPLRLFWSLPDRTFDLSDPDARLELYETVLQEAARVEDLTTYLNKDLLIGLWPRVYHKGVRRTWEDTHPALRAAAAKAAA
jgi:hypothetical protein